MSDRDRKEESAMKKEDEHREIGEEALETETVRKAIEESLWLEMDIRSKTEQMLSLKEAAGRITSAMAERENSRPRRPDTMEKAVVSMVDLENEISGEICRLMDVQKQMMSCFNRLKQPENRTVLQLRYLNRKSWQEIADLMDCSRQTIYRRHRMAMKELKQLMPMETWSAGRED